MASATASCSVWRSTCRCCRGSAAWSAPCPGWRWRWCARCFPALFGLFAVVVRRLPGWPIWFAVLWAAQEWLKSTVPFGGFPVGRGGLRSDRRPVAAVGPARRRSAAVVGDRVGGMQRRRDRAGDRDVVAAWPRVASAADTGRRRAPRLPTAPPAVVLPGYLHLPGVVR